MNRIQKDQTIITHVTRDLREQYVIGKGVHATLVFLVQTTGTVSVEPDVRLSGAKSSADIIGVVLGEESARVTIKTIQHHQAPDTSSNLLVKTVMTGKSECTYEGSIIVDALAQKTDAYQKNENLLLDEHARAVSKPALEILANDVRCTHGAVVKTLDPQELWYLATRGISVETARGMITDGFLSSAIDAISNAGAREEVRNTWSSLVTGKEHI